MSDVKYSAKKQAVKYRSSFPELWSAFLRKHFESPEHVAVVFWVDGSTARNWWAGSHSPSGFAVGIAYQELPTEAAAMLRMGQ
ncbi:hypothetical protein [Cereibacter changlensis]|uniref:hypothetical protein n=1 Tax=Cereibacter changlensis TaxID=402884 RepID=UPI004034894C